MSIVYDSESSICVLTNKDVYITGNVKCGVNNIYGLSKDPFACRIVDKIANLVVGKRTYAVSTTSIGVLVLVSNKVNLGKVNVVDLSEKHCNMLEKYFFLDISKVDAVLKRFKVRVKREDLLSKGFLFLGDKLVLAVGNVGYDFSDSEVRIFKRTGS